MKRTFLLALTMTSLFACQSDRNKQYLAVVSILPGFEMLLLDSSTIFEAGNTPIGKPLLIFYFRPDCPHCRKETKALLNIYDQWKDCHIYMLAGASLDAIRQYVNEFHLDQYKNITVGKDYQHSFVNIFHPEEIPFLAIYNSHKQLLKIYHGEVQVDKLIAVENS
jgi:thiol-disulfide isomerase/thioredoxin